MSKRTTKIKKKKVVTVSGLIEDRINGYRNTKREVMEFLYLFFLCDIVVCTLISKVSSIELKQVKLDLRQIKSVFRKLGLSINEETTNAIFASEKSNGKKSAKKLRNMYAHNLSKTAEREIYQRNKELSNLMVSFLTDIKGFSKFEYFIEE